MEERRIGSFFEFCGFHNLLELPLGNLTSEVGQLVANQGRIPYYCLSKGMTSKPVTYIVLNSIIKLIIYSYEMKSRMEESRVSIKVRRSY